MQINKQTQLNKTLYDYLKLHATKNGNKTYLITEEKEISYGEALDIVETLGSTFLKQGIKKGDLVAIKTTRTIETVLLVIALASIGAVVVFCHAKTDVKEFLSKVEGEITPGWYLMNDTGKQKKDNWYLEGSNKDRYLINLKTEKESISDRYYEATQKVEVDDLFMIIFTSGSTGKNKAVMLSHKNCMANPIDTVPLYEENELDRAIQLLPLSHVFGFGVITSATLCGHDVFFPKSRDSGYILHCIEKYHITLIFAVPTIFLGLVTSVKEGYYDISSLRLGVIGGGPVSNEQMKQIECSLQFKLLPIYGMSECFISSMSLKDNVELCRNGVGRLLPMTEAYIKKEDGEKAAFGEVGEIHVRGATRMMGYYADKARQERLVPNDWLSTGDIGYFDDNNILHLCGRKKEIIIRGGENISAVKVELALLNMKGVREAAVIPIKNEKYGEIVGAVLVLEQGESISEELLKNEVSKHLYQYEIPSEIKFVDRLPKTSIGKLDKIKIKEMF